MRIALVTDAWEPQVNGVVTTLRELVRELTVLQHTVDVIHPAMFRTRPCPGYAPRSCVASVLCRHGCRIGIRVRWLGLLPRERLAQVYAAADVFVFPSLSETFGLVMLEAMASGTPVVAYPSDGPDVVLAGGQGGVCDTNLVRGWYRARMIPRWQARARALEFDWAHAARLFAGHLVPVRAGASCPETVTPMSSFR